MLVFCISLIAYNALRVRAAMAAVLGEEAADQVSDYYLTELVFTDWRALDIFATPEEWIGRFGNSSAKSIARKLKRVAKHVEMSAGDIVKTPARGMATMIRRGPGRWRRNPQPQSEHDDG